MILKHDNVQFVCVGSMYLPNAMYLKKDKYRLRSLQTFGIQITNMDTVRI